MSNSHNSTIDVANKGCFGSYDRIACIRNSILISLMALTFIGCLARIVRLHVVKHPQIHQYIIFYFACVECIICVVNWSIGGSQPQIDISASYLKLLQFIAICHFYWTLAARILRQEHLVFRVILPILAIYVLYFTTVAVVGIVMAASSWTECLEPEWLMMSAAEFLVVQLFMVAGRYITIKINAISALESFKRAQKTGLWGLIIVYELSALLSVTYDAAMRILGDRDTGCSGIFSHSQLSYSLIFAFFMVIKFMLPVWTMLAVFKPNPTRMNEDEERFLQWSNECGPTTSVFNNTRRTHSYKQLYDPSTPAVIDDPTFHSSTESASGFTNDSVQVKKKISTSSQVSHSSKNRDDRNKRKKSSTSHRPSVENDGHNNNNVGQKINV
ncbi:Uncharacterised protein g9460 [Pycnogonum litorale]